VGQYLASEIAGLGPFELLCDSNPTTGIPTVTWRIRDGEKPGYTLFDLASLLLDDFRDAVEHFARHPVTVSMSKEESGGFSHL
jgi:glutamate decarboxylase